MADSTQLHEDLSRQDEVRGSSDRSFGIVFTGVFLIIGLWPLVGGGDLRVWSIGVAAIFLLAAFARPSVLNPLNRVWFRFGMLLHRVASPIVLGLLFFVVVTPIGLLMRLLGSRPLQLRFDPTADSYWFHRQPVGPAPETMTRQF